ncbi:MAG: DUF1667 domain-containing protein [Clostridiaceae bacterium]
MKKERAFTCIVCPNGCVIETQIEDGKLLSITGNKCKRGEEYVQQELADPRRTIATTVPIENTSLPLCSVRLNRPIPKREIFRVMREIDGVRLVAPVQIGQIVLKNVCGLDSDVIVTKDMEAAE